MAYLLVAVLASAVAVFALQNVAPVNLRFLFWEIEQVTVSLVILISLAAGVVGAGIPLWIQRWRLRARLRALQARVDHLESQAARTTKEPSRPAGGY